MQKGLLTGKFTPETTFSEGDIRHDWTNEPGFKDSLQKVERLRGLEREGQSLGQVALRFVLSHPAVSVAIPGGKTPEQVEANAGASVRPLLSEEELQLIDEVAPGEQKSTGVAATGADPA